MREYWVAIAEKWVHEREAVLAEDNSTIKWGLILKLWTEAILWHPWKALRIVFQVYLLGSEQSSLMTAKVCNFKFKKIHLWNFHSWNFLSRNLCFLAIFFPTIFFHEIFCSWNFQVMKNVFMELSFMKFSIMESSFMKFSIHAIFFPETFCRAIFHRAIFL